MIQGICGRTYFASGVPDGPLWEWESRLRERLATVGSTESALIWREKASPAGQSISRLAVSTRHTNGTGNIGSQWRSPTAGDRRGGAYSDPEKAIARINSGHTVNLEDQVVANASHWCTASARDWKDSPGMATEAGDRKRIDQLPRQMSVNAEKAYSPTPTVADVQGGRKARSGARSGEPLLNGICYGMEPTGPTPNGSSATTGRRGAPNPVFAFWLMGFPAEWISGALEAMRSYRKPRRK